MKIFTITFTENENGNVECRATNQGFTGMELLGLLEVKKADVLKQFMYPDAFERRIIDDDGTVSELVHKSEDVKWAEKGTRNDF